MKRERKVKQEMDAIARWENEGGSCRECSQSQAQLRQPKKRPSKQNSNSTRPMKLMSRFVQAASHMPKLLHQ